MKSSTCKLLTILLAPVATRVLTLAADPVTYARPELLIEPADLAKTDPAKPFIVLDARDRKKHTESRVPKSRWVDAPAWAKAFGQGMDAEAWSQRIGALGIAPGARVVVYDDASAKDAARVWWILRYWGATEVRLLNGGWQGWTAAKLPVESGEPPAPSSVAFTARAHSDRLATKEELIKALGDGSHPPQIVDARSESEFCGTEKQSNKRGGAIPGARNLEWIDLIDKPTQRFKTAEDLKKLFAGAGIELGAPVTTHCQSGGRSSVMAFALELMGAKDVKNYYASWAEWGNADDTPIVPGKAKDKK